MLAAYAGRRRLRIPLADLGTPAPEGAPWDHPESIDLYPLGIEIPLEEVSHARHVEVGLDENDDVARSIVLEDRERLLQSRNVLLRGIDEQVDVLGGPLAAQQNDGEASDQDVARFGVSEGAADPADVFERRWADLRDISLLIHSWASSKVAKRSRPLGARPIPPRRAQAVRSMVSTRSGVGVPSRRRPTVFDGSMSISRSRSIPPKDTPCPSVREASSPANLPHT